MSGIKIHIKDEAEKAKLIKEYLTPDVQYLKALDGLKKELVRQGVDLDSKEGRKKFILAVRELNIRFGAELHKDIT